MNPVADTPSVTGATTNEDTQTTSGLVITRSVNDSTEVTHFKITNILHGSLFQSNGTTAITAGSFITSAEGTAGLKFTPAANYSGPASFDVQASIGNSDAGLGGSVVTASIAVNPIADTPSVTGSTTSEDVKTTTGLVITRNAADGNEVPFYKITNITHGTLFQNDGTTEILAARSSRSRTEARAWSSLPTADYFGARPSTCKLDEQQRRRPGWLGRDGKHRGRRRGRHAERHQRDHARGHADDIGPGDQPKCRRQH